MIGNAKNFIVSRGVLWEGVGGNFPTGLAAYKQSVYKQGSASKEYINGTQYNPLQPMKKTLSKILFRSATVYF